MDSLDNLDTLIRNLAGVAKKGAGEKIIAGVV
jgi:hypothetical protein